MVIQLLAKYLPFLIIGLNVLISYKGFNDRGFFQKYLFQVDGILRRKEKVRMVSSGFLHADWVHLGFNMYTLYIFSGRLMNGVGPLGYLAIYFAALIGGNLFSLFMNRNNPMYQAIGASGAVSGILFASIVLFPDGHLLLFFILPIPKVLFAFLYTVYTIYGMQSKRDNIGHDAHLGGGVVGLLTVLFIAPERALENYITLLLVLVPTVIFIVFLLKFPHLLTKEGWINGKLFKKKKAKMRVSYNADEEYNAIKREKEQEVDRILEKISSKGINSLSQDEKNFLDLNS